ncbi:MAG: protein translocase subunit SecF [Alphaproteobacteria bacterium]|jgi:preprotein translocase subunit SecF|nr:protein translocase subunit SecF [Alphaproteobacteria bacterium]
MRIRLIKDGTRIPFMRGRFTGLAVSALLSLLSVILYFYPGVNFGIDFRGGVVMEVRMAQDADFGGLRDLFTAAGHPHAALQEFGSKKDVLIRMEATPGPEGAQQAEVEKIRGLLTEKYPGTEFRRVEAVGGAVSSELYRNGLLAMGLALVAMLFYIWFRFEWQFGVGAIVTLVLDVTKTFGFYAITGIPFNLSSIAAVLTVMGFSVNDKVVVYDRVRENLRKYKSMPLRELIDLSINETLNRTLNVSLTTFLAIVPLAFFGGEAVQTFAWVMLFGVLLACSSSIFIAAPILLFLGENRLRRGGVGDEKKKADGGAAATAP